MKKLVALPLLFLTLVLLTGCVKLQPTLAGMSSVGEWEGKTYQNSIMHFTISIPDEWVLASDDQIRSLNEISVDFWTGDDPELQRILDDANKGKKTLFIASKYPIDKQGGPEIICEQKAIPAELLASKNAIKDYHQQARNFYDKTVIKMNLGEDIIKKCGNSDFTYTQLDYLYEGIQVMGGSYTKEIDDHFLIIKILYFDNEGKKECEDVLDTLRIS